MEDCQSGYNQAGKGALKLNKFWVLLFTIICFTFPAIADAEVILEDTFNTITMVDMSKTKAVVDTTGGYVRLPKNQPNAIAMLKYGEGYAVTISDGVIISEYDAATGNLHDTKIDWLAGARGLAIRQDNMNLWVIGEDSVQYCQFSGGAYSDDPALKSSGLTEVLSVSAVESTDRAVVLSRTADGKAKITRYRAGATLTVELEKELDYNEPVAVSVVDGTPDVMVVTRTEQHYLIFDDSTQDYIEDPARKASGYTNIISASSNLDGTAILEGSDGQYLQYDDAGGVQQVLAYSAGSVPGAVALSLKPGAYDQAFITDNGEIRYYAYNDATDSMVRVADLEKNDLQLNIGYLHPKDYYSKVINTGTQYNTVLLTSSQDLPPGTSIAWYVSSDGGNTWTNILLDTWTLIRPGSQFIIHGVLDTTDTSVTPKINEVTLAANAITGIRLAPTSLSVEAQHDPTTHTLISQFIGSLVITTVTADGQGEQDITDLVNWNSSNSNVAYVNGPGQVYNGPYAGTATINASYNLFGNTLISNPCTVTVNVDIPPNGFSGNSLQIYRRNLN